MSLDLATGTYGTLDGATVRTLLSKLCVGMFTADALTRRVPLDAGQVRGVLAALFADGLVSVVDKRPRDSTTWYQITAKGRAFARPAPRTVARGTVTRALATLLARAGAINVDPASTLRVAEVVISGEYLDTDRRRVPVLTVHVALTPYATPTTDGHEQLREGARRATLLRRLRGRSKALEVSVLDDEARATLADVEHRQVFRAEPVIRVQVMTELEVVDPAALRSAAGRTTVTDAVAAVAAAAVADLPGCRSVRTDVTVLEVPQSR